MVLRRALRPHPGLDAVVAAEAPALAEVDFARLVQQGLRDAGLRCRLDIPALLPAQTLPSGLRHRLMMVVKEVLTNVLRHARATEVRIRLALEGSTLIVTLRDDGCGMGEPGKSRRNGIANMHERMREIGGTCTIASTPGGGTTVELRLTLKEAGA